MKVGLCTPYKILNYGTKLQAYAVQEKIRSMGYEVEIVDFIRKSDLRPNKLFHRYCNAEFVRTKLKSRRGAGAADEEYRIGLKKRTDAIHSFDQTHYIKSGVIRGFSGLRENAKSYAAVVCGSDQIWLPSNVYNPTVTLEFAPKGCKRIAFAPSFGVSQVPKSKRKEFVRFLKNMDAISVREDSGRAILSDLIQQDVPVVLDPTLAVDPAVWRDLQRSGRTLVSGNYVFCYFLGTSPQHRAYVKKIAAERGLKIVALPHFIEYNAADEHFADVNLYDVTPCDFLRLIAEAALVCTDSFHASAFSILFGRQFYTFERFQSRDRQSTNSRIDTLLNRIGLESRRIAGACPPAAAPDISAKQYDAVAKRLAELRKQTDDYLERAFRDVPRSRPNSSGFSAPEPQDCCGCTACVAACPQQCLEMAADPQTGFHYPRLADPSRCIRCAVCSSVCPEKSRRNVLHSISQSYYGRNTERAVRLRSASGGIFSALAKRVLEDGGYVCAARYDETHAVVHTIVSDPRDLPLLAGSKYAESRMNDCFPSIQALLSRGETVLFCGTPCQAHGLKAFLGREYENLFLVDLLCYGIQSPRAWEAYLTEVRGGKDIRSINMRAKDTGWEQYSMKITFADGTTYLTDREKDPYLRSYAEGLFLRPSCFSCNLKAFPRSSDITIGDLWDYDAVCREENDQTGMSILIPHTPRAEAMLEALREDGSIEYRVIDARALDRVHPLFCLPSKKNRNYARFFRLLRAEKLPFSAIINVCAPSGLEKGLRGVVRKAKHRLK